MAGAAEGAAGVEADWPQLGLPMLDGREQWDLRRRGGSGTSVRSLALAHVSAVRFALVSSAPPAHGRHLGQNRACVSGCQPAGLGSPPHERSPGTSFGRRMRGADGVEAEGPKPDRAPWTERKTKRLGFQGMAA